MSNETRHIFCVPPDHQAIPDESFYPTGKFLEPLKDEVESSIPDSFEKIAQLYPDRLAVKTDSHTVTYAELNAMANRVAHAIVAERGNKPEPIGMLLDKGVEQIAAMLGILKTGKFFILLDPSLPTERLALVLEDSQAALLLVDQGTQSLVRQDTPARRKSIRIDTLADSLPVQDLKIPISPHALACIVYTSGSTGRPKGVMRQHRALLHDAMLRVHTDGISSNDRLAHITAGTANAVTNSFYALLQGAALVTFDLKRQGVARLASWLIDEKISVCLIASPVFRSLCATLTGTERFPDLRYLRLRSDTVYSADVALHRKYFPPTCVVATGLASTEAGVLREYRIRHDAELSGSEVPVGYALSGNEILLLNENGKEVGFNEIGEIVVRSEYLSSGYWNDPELTAEKFKLDPQDSKKRRYYTGDLGQMLPDGCLIHKGRKDFRVKIRGYGVDLIEVEKILRSHEAIKDAVVVAKPGESGDARMIAYYTPERRPGATADELRTFLRANLADYMVPSAFVKLDALPLTANGKVNRNALPEPGHQRPELNESYQSPRNATEQALVQIWEAVLDVRPVGVGDNFFDLGGHSLTATRLVSEVLRYFEWELPLQQLFQCPTVAEIAVVIDKHRGQKFKSDNLLPFPAVSTEPVPKDRPLPLAHAQQGLWFIDQLHPSSIAYNLFSAYRLRGKLNLSALEKSFNEIIRRHEVLRTVFKSVDNIPVQIILPSLTIEMPVIDLQGIASQEDQETEVRRLGTEEAQRPFDLARGPLLRITLLRLAQNEYVLLRAIHHTVFDAWSSGVLHRELAQLYKTISEGESSPPADLSIQYANYAVWQRQCLETGALGAQLSYWKTQLANLPLSPLPTDRPRPPFNRYRGARQYYKLSKHVCAGLRALSRRYGVTLFTILLSAFQTLISRHSGQTDVVIGSPVAGRNRSEFDESIGHFLNMLVLRTDLSGNPTFAEASARVWKVCLEALSHQDLPFQKLVEELQPARDLSHDPLVQVTFAFLGRMNIPPQLPGIEVSSLEVETGIARFDLQVEIEDQGDCLGGFVDYNVDLFEADTISRMLQHLRVLLESIVTNPDRSIFELPLLTEAERRKLLIEWNDTTRDFPKDKCIHQLFEVQAERTPDAIAVVFEGQQLTYRQLNQRSNQLAHYLRKLGVGPEVLVGLGMERSIEMVIGLLGILKAGGAYLPLDPNYPAERLEFMLDDAQVSVLLTKERALEAEGSSAADRSDRSSFLDRRIQRISLDRDGELIARESDTNPESFATADNLAYVIYTSGSTGQPKGIAIEHRNTVAFLSWVHSTFTREDLCGVLAGTSICFDLSVFELFAPLTCGGRVVMAENALALTRLSAAAQVTLLNTVPSAMTELLNLRAIPASVRVINLAGEPLRPALVRRIYESTSVCKVHDLYGPSECTTYSTWTHRTVSGPQTIGRPIANTRIYLLDAHLNPAPIGVIGEIYIGGEGVARGYLNRPELTAGRFIAHSFDGEVAQRLYKTGDLGRYLPDGNIEFLGRRDHQVKVRGYRIDLGEIEAVLAQHPAVRESVVIVKEDSAGEQRLVAYIVPRESAPATNELGAYLKAKLPDYMIPGAVVVFDAIPLTANGKVDRQALPEPDRAFADSLACVGPRNSIEESIAGIWAEILGVKQIGVHDNFFDLGGHSLKATQVVARLRNVLKSEIPLRHLFEFPTVAELAAAIDSKTIEGLKSAKSDRLLNAIEEMSEEELQRRLAH